MKKGIIILIIALAIGFGVFYFLFNLEEKFVTEPYIIGEIYALSENRVLIAEGVVDNGYTGDLETLRGNASWITIKEETDILDPRGREMIWSELETGFRVEVWITGPILESYPTQVTASKIVVTRIPEKQVKDCFIGGCSGEICSNDQEVISTCELILGMGCLKEDMSCQLVDNECTWVLSKEAAECFLEVEQTHGSQVRETRINYFFNLADQFFD